MLIFIRGTMRDECRRVLVTAAVLLLLCRPSCVQAIRVPLATRSTTAAQYDKCLVVPPGSKLSSYGEPGTHPFCAGGTSIFLCKAKISADQYAGCCREVSTDSNTGGQYMLCCYGLVNAGPFTADKPNKYCSEYGIETPSGIVWANSAGPFAHQSQSTSTVGQRPWAGNFGQGAPTKPTNSVGKVTVDEEVPTASATVSNPPNPTSGDRAAQETKALTELEKVLPELERTMDEAVDKQFNDLPHGLKGVQEALNKIRKIKNLPREAKDALFNFGKQLRRLAPLAEKAVTACVIRCLGCALISEKDYDCLGDCSWDPTKYITC